MENPQKSHIFFYYQGMEVFKFDGTNACYARPIPPNVNSVWTFKSLLEIAQEVGLKFLSISKQRIIFLKILKTLYAHKSRVALIYCIMLI